MRNAKMIRILAVTLLAVQAGAFVAPAPAGAAESANPFAEGTGQRQLTATERASLLEFAENSRAVLAEALENALGRGFTEANSIYVEAIKRVVVASYQSRGRSELLLRYALNQALELTVGVPTADGRTPTPGVLAGSVNRELMTVILEDSIRLALKYFPADRRAIQTGQLVKLPYMEFSFHRLALAQKWAASVIEWGVSYGFLSTITQQWLNTALNEDNLSRVAYAEEIVKIDTVLKNSSEGDLKAKVRHLRGVVRKLVEALGAKLKLDPREAASFAEAGAGLETKGVYVGERVWSQHGEEARVVRVFSGNRVSVEVDGKSFSVSTENLAREHGSSGGFSVGDSVEVIRGASDFRVVGIFGDGTLLLDRTQCYTKNCKVRVLVSEIGRKSN